MKKDKVRIYASEIVEHVWTVDEDKCEEEFQRIREDDSWLVNRIESESYSREHVRVRYLDFVD